MKVIAEPTWSFKLLPDALAELNIYPGTVIHVGAHWGQEVPVYLQCGFEWIVLVEPDPENYRVILEAEWWDPDRMCFLPVAISPEKEKVQFHRVSSGNGVWSGIKPNPERPEANAVFDVPTMTLASIQTMYAANVLVVDTQGTELEALQTANLDNVDLVIVETQVEGLDGADPAELHNYAEYMGWEPVIVWDRTGGWTDTLLVPKR